MCSYSEGARAAAEAGPDAKAAAAKAGPDAKACPDAAVVAGPDAEAKADLDVAVDPVPTSLGTKRKDMTLSERMAAIVKARRQG